MKLDTYLAEEDMKNHEFAALIDLDTSSVSRLRRGEIDPSFDTLRRIAKATNLKVMPNDFLDLDPAVLAEAAS